MANNGTSVDLKIKYHPKQSRIFFNSNAKVKVIAKGRRFGLTHGYANFSIEEALDKVSPILWVDTVNGNIDRYVERYFVPTLRQIPQNYWKWRQQKKELSIFSSKIDFRSADRPERIEGFAYKLIILNEAGIILKDQYLWENVIRPMAFDFDPSLLIGGTPKGQNIFHDLKIKAQDTQDERYKDWEFFHFTSYDNPYVDHDVIAKLEQDLPDHVKRQEIYAEFLEDAASVFRNVEACIGSVVSKPKEGFLYYMGVDLAKHVDFTVISILDEHGNQVYFRRLNKLEWAYQKKLILETAKLYNARIILDATGVGDPIYDDLRREDVDIVGYKFTSESKRQLIERLMISVEQERVKLLDEPVQTNEMKIFGWELSKSGAMSYSAPPNQHDDCVIALALANWGVFNRRIGRIHILGGETGKGDDIGKWEQDMLQKSEGKKQDSIQASIEHLKTETIARAYKRGMNEGKTIDQIAKELSVDPALMRQYVQIYRTYIENVPMI